MSEFTPNPDSGSMAPGGGAEASESRGGASVSPKATRSIRLLILALILIPVLYGLIHFVTRPSADDLAKVQGKVSLTEQQLRDVVATKHLIVFWVGPVAGDTYTLFATTPGVANVRYLPSGVGADNQTTPFRAVGTYVYKDAYRLGISNGALLGNAGFINADGHSIFYSLARPTNVYVGIKDKIDGKDIQVEVFDPAADQAQGLVTIKGQIQQIK